MVTKKYIMPNNLERNPAVNQTDIDQLARGGQSEPRSQRPVPRESTVPVPRDSTVPLPEPENNFSQLAKKLNLKTKEGKDISLIPSESKKNYPKGYNRNPDPNKGATEMTTFASDEENPSKDEKDEDQDIKNKVEELNTSYNELIEKNNDNNKIAKEAMALASAQRKLDNLSDDEKKEKKEKKVKKEEEEEEKKVKNILAGTTAESIVELKEQLKGKHVILKEHIEKEIGLLEQVRSLSGLTAKDASGNDIPRNKFHDAIDSKIKEKKREAEKLRHKKWWEKTFFHNNEDSKDNTVVNSDDSPSFLRKIKADLSSPEIAFFIFFCFVSITIFTITLFTAYNNKAIYDENIDLMKKTNSFYTFGIVILIMFLLFLSLSFGEDKDFKQKIGSFILINGSIYMGAFYTYLKSSGDLINLNNYENLASQLVVAFFIIFLLASVAYVLSERRSGSVGRLLGIFYLLTCVIGFFVLGGVVTSFNSKLKIPKGENETLLVPLSTAFFAIGIFLFTSAVIDSIPSVNRVISRSLNSVINALEPKRIKLLIIAGVVMSIYYTYTFFKVYNSKYISGDKKDPENFPDIKDKGINGLIKTSYLLGLGLIASIIFSLSLSFGGTLKEKAIAIFLTSFVMFCGSYIAFLDGEAKIKKENNQINTMVTASIAVFMILLVACVAFVVFGKRSGSEVLIQDSLKIASNFGALILFFYMFGICTAVAFQEFEDPSLSGTPEGVFMWVGFGVGLGIILLFLYSFY